MQKNDRPALPLATKINLYLERQGTYLISNILKKDKKSINVHSVHNIPYSTDKTNPMRQFDWHCPRFLALNAHSTSIPVLFYIHGGSWSAADKSIYSRLCKDFAEQGIIVININYRLMPENPFEDTFADVVQCINFCLQNADMFGINRDMVFFGGDSAGAHLSSLVCAKATSGKLALDCQIRGAFLFYGVYDLKNLGKVNFRSCRVLDKGFKKLYKDDPAALTQFYNEYSPIEYVTSAFPPCVVAAGKIDHLTRTESLEFIKKLDALGVEHTDVIFPKSRLDARHAFMNLSVKAHKQTLLACFEFLHQKIDHHRTLNKLRQTNSLDKKA